MGTTITNWFSVSESVVNRESWIVSHSADVEVIKMVRYKEIEGGSYRYNKYNSLHCKNYRGKYQHVKREDKKAKERKREK